MRMAVTDGVLAASFAYSRNARILSPWNFSGQWHCSHVSRAGRRLVTGEGIGRENVLSVTANTWRVPDSFDRTNHGAPEPIWHPTQGTRAWLPAWYAVYSGCITSWHTVPQKVTESMNSMPR